MKPKYTNIYVNAITNKIKPTLEETKQSLANSLKDHMKNNNGKRLSDFYDEFINHEYQDLTELALAYAEKDEAMFLYCNPELGR